MAERSFRRLSLVLAASLLLSGCAQQADPAAETAEEAAVAVKAVSAQIGTLAVSNEFIGTVSPQQQVTVMPMVSGEVDQVYFEVGDEVKAGDVLFHIRDDAARLQKENAELTRKSAEITAQMQLGSSQVMNNISMQSNIRSIEFQIENAKDQYQSAVDGIVDAQQAKTEMEDALSEIESSLAEMNANQARRSEVVARAERYIESTSLVGGEYRYKSAYDHSHTPDYYLWPDPSAPSSSGSLGGLPGLPGISYQAETMSEEDMPDAAESQESQAQGASRPKKAQGKVQPEGTQEKSQTEEAQETESKKTDPADQEETEPTEATAPEETEEAGEMTESAGEEESETKETAGAESKLSEPASTGAEETGESQTESEEAAGMNLQGFSTEAFGKSETFSPAQTQSVKNGEKDGGLLRAETVAVPKSFYFNLELIEEADPFYLATSGYLKHDGDDPDGTRTTLEQAWAAYREQQEINAAKADAEELGYDAYDIGSGAASSEILEHAAQIAALEYQASQLRSNQASLDSSIDQAVTARDTTEKTIDFYEDNLQDAQVTYGIANGQAYQDSAAALATQMQAADVGIKSANLQLEYYSPTSPISGTVVSRSVEQYGLAQPGYAAFVISNQDAMNVTFSVSEQVRANLYVGMPVTLEKNGNIFTGTVMEIGEAADAQSGGLFVIKAVTEAGGDQLISGTAVKLTVDTFRTDNAVLIPYDAVHFESEQAYVFVVTEEDTAVRTPVTLGLMSEDMVEVTEGLSAGDRLVATWSTQLEDGVKVRVIGAQTAPEETGE